VDLIYRLHSLKEDGQMFARGLDLTDSILAPLYAKGRPCHWLIRPAGSVGPSPVNFLGIN
jgi:hypothetical protein